MYYVVRDKTVGWESFLRIFDSKKCNQVGRFRGVSEFDSIDQRTLQDGAEYIQSIVQWQLGAGIKWSEKQPVGYIDINPFEEINT